MGITTNVVLRGRPAGRWPTGPSWPGLALLLPLAIVAIALLRWPTMADDSSQSVAQTSTLTPEVGHPTAMGEASHGKSLPDYAIQAMAKPEVAAVAIFLRLSSVNRDAAIGHLQAVHGNAFVQKVLAYRPTAEELTIGNRRISLFKHKQQTGMPGLGDSQISEADVSYDVQRGQAGAWRTGDESKAHSAALKKAKAEAVAKPIADGKYGKAGELAQKIDVSTSLTSSYNANWWASQTEQYDLGDGATAQVNGRMMHAEQISGSSVSASTERLQVAGNAGATVTLIGGRAQIASPELAFNVFGEDMAASVSVGVDAGAYVEAHGKASLDVGWNGSAVDVSMNGFAGVKAGITAAGTLLWRRHTPDHYAKLIVRGGAWRPMLAGFIPAYILNSVTDKTALHWVEKIVTTLMTGNGTGDALVLGASARAEGSAGIGSDSSFSAGFRGGVLHCHGRGGFTFGLGGAVSSGLALGVGDGMAMLGIMAMLGKPQLGAAIGPDLNIVEYVKSKVLGLKSTDDDDGPAQRKQA